MSTAILSCVYSDDFNQYDLYRKDVAKHVQSKTDQGESYELAVVMKVIIII